MRECLGGCDIRGSFPDMITEEQAFLIGKCFGTVLRRRSLNSVCVGYDGKKSSEILESRLIQGVKCSGVLIYRLGLSTTPEVYFAEYEYMAGGAVVVTGSHGEGNCSGFKFSLNKEPFFGVELKEEFCAIIKNNQFLYGKGYEKKVSISSAYIKYLSKDFNKHYITTKSLKVVWDPGNGVATNTLKRFVKIFPGKHEIINEKLDTNFPNHHPDPSKYENMKQLVRHIKQDKADLGIAFDVDADRIGLVDGEGRVIPVDLLSVLFLEEIGKTGDCVVIGDVKCTKVFFDMAKRYKCKSIINKTGHSFMKERLKVESGKFACEASGHIYFADRVFWF